MSAPTPAGSTSSARVLSIIGIVFGAVAVFFFPIVFGPVGAILGFIGHSKGDRPMGLWVGIGCIAATIVGMILGAVVYNQTR